jgi:excisionase family DNA binding protein
MEILLTTSQAASLLQVHESSVKRWSNDGRVRPAKTTGGHRRITLSALLELARKMRAESALLRLAPHGEALAMATLACRERNDFSPMVDLVLRFCDHESVHFLTEALRYLADAADIPITRAFDSILAEALRRVGRQWEEGSRTVAMEHRFTQKVLDALHTFRARASAEPDALAPLALIGCAETCQHEIGAMFCRVALEMDGWRVCYLGANVPTEEYAGIQAHLGADLVCISFIPPVGTADARRSVKILASGYRPERPYALAFGGGILNAQSLESGEMPFKAFKVHHGTEAFLRWANARTGFRRGTPVPSARAGA